MAKLTLQFDSILGGIQPTEFYNTQGNGQIFNSLGIDPEMPKTDSLTRPSGLIRPTSMEKISGSTVTGAPMWFLTNPKNANIYCYANDGKVHLINSNLTMGSDLSTPTNGAGQGAVYYNNYLYFATTTDISRFGPLNGSPTMTNNWWTSTLSKTALANTTYPTINGVMMPKHAMYVHPWNSRVYFCDVTSDGIGCLSMIKTKKVTVEGDTDDTLVPSSYKVLDFFYGWLPTCISNIGSELAIGLIEGTDTTTKQGNAKVAFWSTVASDTSYNRIAQLPDPIITSLTNVNGILYAITGSASGGMRISRYIGGESFEEVAYLDDQLPALAGATDFVINRILWGGKTTLPAVSGSVFSLGSKSKAMGMGLHNILKSTAGATTPMVTALKYVSQGAIKQPIVGWKDNTGTAGALVAGIDKLSTTYGTSYLTFPLQRIGRNFQIISVSIPLSSSVSANQTVEVRALIDGGSSDVLLGTINNTNYSGARRVGIDPESSFGFNDFCLQLKFTGSALTTIQMPVLVDIEVIEDTSA